MKLQKLMPVLFLLLCSAACGPSHSALSKLAGTWRTADPRYEDKFMQFDDEFVVLGLGEGTLPQVAKIVKVTTKVDGPITTYVIESRTQQGQAGRLTVQYAPKDGGELHVSNVIWKKSQ